MLALLIGAIVRRARASRSPRAPDEFDLSRLEGAARAFARSGWRATFDDYLELTKPRIIVLLLITTLAAMIMAARGIRRSP